MGDHVQEQPICSLQWPVASIESQFEMMTLGSGRGVELDFAWDGVQVKVFVFVNGVQPEGLYHERNHYI